jgi:hypothetical protein
MDKMLPEDFLPPDEFDDDFDYPPVEELTPVNSPSTTLKKLGFLNARCSGCKSLPCHCKELYEAGL